MIDLSECLVPDGKGEIAGLAFLQVGIFNLVLQ